MPKIRPLIKGIGSFVIPSLRTTHKPLGTISAQHCYSIFMRNISLLMSVGVPCLPKVVAELGPGSSFGTGFAALIAGADKYYALDLIDHSDINSNLRVFDELVSLFQKKATIPASGRYSLIFPDLDSYDFPALISLDPHGVLFSNRIKDIREDIIRRSGVFFEVAAPWARSNIIKQGTVDWLFSHSVLEHVDDPKETYHAIAKWLRHGGYGSHLIDFDCHGLTDEWNGHWAIKDAVWFAMRGKRPYLLNRNWCEIHMQLAAENGFATLLERRNKRFDGLIREQFQPRFRNMTDEDARTRMVCFIHQKLGPVLS
jgi:SAM-dependent methyltransferase